MKSNTFYLKAFSLKNRYFAFYTYTYSFYPFSHLIIYMFILMSEYSVQTSFRTEVSIVNASMKLY